MSAGRTAAALPAGVLLSLLSTCAGERTALATYPEVMGCEQACDVTATGWPLVFIRDYTGMSVVGTADLAEVLFAADRFDWMPFAANVLIWSVLAAALLRLTALRRSGDEG